MIALVPVRDGVLPAGAPDAIAEAGGRVVIAGSGTADAAVDGLASQVYLAELGAVEIARWTSALAPVIAELPEMDRRLVTLKYYDDLKYREISEQTGVSISNVGYRLHHILKELADKLRPFGVDNES